MLNEALFCPTIIKSCARRTIELNRLMAKNKMFFFIGRIK
jgi:hypothetical protein